MPLTVGLPMRRSHVLCAGTLTPPGGHIFHLTLRGRGLAWNFSVCVELEYNCPREQLGANLLCLLHHCEVDRRRMQQFNLLDTLCTTPTSM
ncbi:hypothetical protein EK904_011323 [Melospiza melodia maxima]|nr:hypothetical protein EK904_011323 [Melospiza melodia maxima]